MAFQKFVEEVQVLGETWWIESSSDSRRERSADHHQRRARQYVCRDSGYRGLVGLVLAPVLAAVGLYQLW